MITYSLSHLSDHDLMRELAEFAGNERSATAGLLARIAEVDARRLYLPAGYPSMYLYCVHELRLSEDAAYKRIRVARTARRFPVIFHGLADGRLNLTTVVLLTPYLTEQTAHELLSAARHKTKPEVERLLAERFPRSEMLGLVEAIPTSRSGASLEPQRARELVPEPVGTYTSCAPGGGELVPEPVGTPRSLTSAGTELVPEPVGTPACRSKVAPHAPGRFAIHAMIGQSAHDDLRQAQALLGHQLPSGDVGVVLERALRLLVVDLEKRKFAATAQPQHKPRATASPRHIPAHVKRAVWDRDGGQCTYVSGNGRRCSSRTRLEFDHIDPVALGGEATIDRMRLRCRAHNQYTAECELGTRFMSDKRHAARQQAAANARARAAAREREARASAVAAERDVVPWLRQLGYRAEEARAAARFCESAPDATLEDRVRLALSYFRPRTTSRGRAACPAG